MILRLFQTGCQQAHNSFDLTPIDLAITLPRLNPIGYNMGLEHNLTGITERSDPTVVGAPVTKLNNFRHTPEVFDKHNNTTSRFTSDIVDRSAVNVEV